MNRQSKHRRYTARSRQFITRWWRIERSIWKRGWEFPDVAPKGREVFNAKHLVLFWLYRFFISFQTARHTRPAGWQIFLCLLWICNSNEQLCFGFQTSRRRSLLKLENQDQLTAPLFLENDVRHVTDTSMSTNIGPINYCSLHIPKSHSEIPLPPPHPKISQLRHIFFTACISLLDRLTSIRYRICMPFLRLL